VNVDNVADLAVLEGLGVIVDFETRAFVLADMRVPFDAIVHVEIKVSDKTGVVAPGGHDPPGTAWRELLVDVVLVTDDRMTDPRLIGLGARSYSTDGIAPEIQGAPLWARARRIAEAAARVCHRKMIG
jgi:hypothetical protein